MFEKKSNFIQLKFTNNMYLFDHQGQLKKYPNVSSIINGYFDVRYEVYEKRKLSYLKK